jgi:hypothetical protein|tara:strand:- start:273 stop:1310 length:1038 start_codon:yes stop_codon:yes gene_type:complete
MATTYKTITNSDSVNTRTLLHEAIPVTGSIVSGTYTSDGNIKNYSHGMFQSVYDYPYLSSSANHIFDVTVGYSNNSILSASTSTQNAKKINIYNQMAQVLVGFDHTGSVREFDRDGDLSTGTKLKECVFVNFARLLTKDEIKKASFTMSFATGGRVITPDFTNRETISDYEADTTYKVNSPAGEYGILYTASSPIAGTGVGLIYYQAGVAVLTSSLFDSEFGARAGVYDTSSIAAVLTASNITASANGLRNRVYDIAFDNTTELNSTIYFCRAHHSDFNYSSNPTYLNGSKIRVKGNSKANQPVSYVTTIGLYSAANELLAVAKLSEPLKKTPSNELTLRVRLDY